MNIDKNRMIFLKLQAVMFFVGFGFILYSTVLSQIRESYGLSLTQAGLIGTSTSVGQIIILLFNNYIINKTSRIRMAAIGFGVFTAVMFLISAQPPYILLLLCFVFVGGLVELENVVSCAYISEHAHERSDALMNVQQAVYGIGQMAGPILVTYVLAQGREWTDSYLLFGIACVLLLVVLIVSSIKSTMPVAERKKSQNFFALLRKPNIIMTCLIAFCAMGFDLCIITWMPSYMEQIVQAPIAVCGAAMTLYWVGSSAGRLVYPAFFSNRDPKNYMLVLNGCGLVFLGLIVLAPHYLAAVAGFVGVGFCGGINYPFSISFNCKYHGEDTTAAISAACFFAAAGGTVTPSVGGVLGEAYGLGIFPFLLFVLIMGILLLTAGLYRKEARGSQRS